MEEIDRAVNHFIVIHCLGGEEEKVLLLLRSVRPSIPASSLEVRRKPEMELAAPADLRPAVQGNLPSWALAARLAKYETSYVQVPLQECL